MQKVTSVLAMIFITFFWAMPDNVLAQEWRTGEHSGPRGTLQINNDWRDTVTVTVWTHQGERIGDSWDIESGESAFLAIDGQRIKVRPNYKIKVGHDWGRVNVDAVAEFNGTAWHANVRDIWRATHERGGGRRFREDREPPNVPDWQR